MYFERRFETLLEPSGFRRKLLNNFPKSNVISFSSEGVKSPNTSIEHLEFEYLVEGLLLNRGDQDSKVMLAYCRHSLDELISVHSRFLILTT